MTTVQIFGTFICAIALSAQADDCNFIRTRLQALSVRGGEAVIPAGLYNCERPIILDHSNLSLRGDGNVTLRLSDKVNSPLLVMGSGETPPLPLKNISVTNLKLDGNRLNQQMECWGGPCDSGGTAFIRNNGITVRGLTDGRISNVFITGARSGGVVSEKGTYNLIIDDLSVTDSQFDGFAGYETYGAVLSRMNLFGNTAAGISMDIHFDGNTIRDSHIYDNGDVGIFMRASGHNYFANLVIEDSRNFGIFLSQVGDSSTCPNDNEFHDLKVARSRHAGFRFNSACVNDKLTGDIQLLQNREGCISQDPNAVLDVSAANLTCED